MQHDPSLARAMWEPVCPSRRVAPQMWHGPKRIDAETMREWAKKMTRQGLHSVVERSRNVYVKGISLGKAVMQAVEARLERHPAWPKSDMLLNWGSRTIGAKIHDSNVQSIQ